MTDAAHLHELPLRERKAAKTRLAVVESLVDALRDRPFDQITVRSLCQEVGISEPTFFKYFPRKEDPLVLFVALWSIGLAVRAADESLSGKDIAAMVFDETARQMKRSPRVMHEIIAYQMRAEAPPTGAPPTRSELMMRFADEPLAWDLRPLPVQDLIGLAVTRAKDRGEIPRGASVADATWTLVAVFFGVPASTRAQRVVARRYRRALDLVWAGLGSEEHLP
ncbi:MAG: TetR/AcrR family transcriptional regulator [Deltaproteobacteria bacterium]|nr:TetR/AcrR family transcriptional regulator [Deltaproteobacteria bacterium]